MTTIIIFILALALSYGINLGIVALCYALISWAFDIHFLWPIAIAIAAVLFFVELIFKRS